MARQTIWRIEMNYKNLANKGRHGDSELRNVAGQTSHVNPKEANLIDLWGALGESLVQRRGAGTINPNTGMPEYHPAPTHVGMVSEDPNVIAVHTEDDHVGGTQFTQSHIDHVLATTGFNLNPSQEFIDKITLRDHWEEVDPDKLQDPLGSSSMFNPDEWAGDLAGLINSIIAEGGSVEDYPEYDFNNDGVIDVTDIQTGIDKEVLDEGDLTKADPYTI